ncbi:MAG: Ig-like domain-containing protein, partial [Terriglobales bacterium]
SLSRPVDPLSVKPQAFMVCLFNNCNAPLAGTVATSNAAGTTLQFTPLAAFPASTHLAVYAGWNAPLYDLAGSQFSQLYGADFTTGPNATPPAPTVIGFTPASGASGIGPNTVVTLTFNEALSQGTINGSNFALYNGLSNLNASVNNSSDRHVVYLSSTLPYSTTITVSVGTGVQDVAGTPMSAPFTTAFTTIARPLSSNPSIVQMRPANGASGVALTTPITLYASAPIAPASVTSTSVVVLANGIAQTGALAVGTAPATSEGQTIVFTPANPYPAGAYVQVVLTSAVTDTQGNPAQNFSGSFTTAAAASDPSQTGPTLTGLSSGGGFPTNAAVVATFDQALQPGSAAASNFYLLLNNSGAPLAVSVTQIASNVLVLNPGPLQSGSNYYIYLTSGIINTHGLGLIGASGTQYRNAISTGSAASSTTPAVAFVAPTNGATSIGDNANPAVVFNELVSTLSITPQSITLSANGNPIPFTMTFGTNYNQGVKTSVTIYPYLPLPDNATVTLKVSVGGSIVDLAGNVVPEQDITFQTGAGPDFTNPTVVLANPQPSLESVIPTNTVFTFYYSEPLAPYITSNPQIAGLVYDYATNSDIPANLSLSSDGRTITLSPALTAGVQYQVCSPSVYDLAGNASGQSCANFTVASTASGTPQVVYTTPLAGAASVPTNGVIDIGFNEAVNNQSLGQITLTPVSPVGPAVQASA